jgi:hypothetical protein
MINYDFDSRPMTLAEKEILTAIPKDYFRGSIFLFIFFSLMIFWGFMSIGSDESVNWTSRLSKEKIVAIIGSIVPLGFVIFLGLKFGNNNIKKDLEIGLTYLVTAQLEDFMNGDDDETLGMNYANKGSNIYITFYLDNKSIIKLKSFVKPVQFEKISDKSILRKSLKKGNMYAIALCLHSEYVFSIEEINQE